MKPMQRGKKNLKCLRRLNDNIIPLQAIEKSIIQEEHLFSDLRTRDRRIDKESRFHLVGRTGKRVEQTI